MNQYVLLTLGYHQIVGVLCANSTGGDYIQIGIGAIQKDIPIPSNRKPPGFFLFDVGNSDPG